jgi:formate dehydrogenase major subunit
VGRKVSQGETWMPFHFPDSPVNMLTNAALDEFARIPEYKVCAVRLEKIAESGGEKSENPER